MRYIYIYFHDFVYKGTTFTDCLDFGKLHQLLFFIEFESVTLNLIHKYIVYFGGKYTTFLVF